MNIQRNYPAEQLARATKAYRKAVWTRIGFGLVLAAMMVFILSELIQGAFKL